jgi:hypothetical protein
MKTLLTVVFIMAAAWGSYSYIRRRTSAPVVQKAATATPTASLAPNTTQIQSQLQPQPNQQSLRSKENELPITTDLSQGAVKRVQVAPNVPEFTLKFLPAQGAKPYETAIDSIQVFRDKEEAPWQVLEECESPEVPYRDAEWVMFQDFNFDGYKDVEMLRWWGATGREGFCVWLYKPETGKFDYSKEYEKLEGKISWNPDSKTISVRDNEKHTGAEYEIRTYKVVNNNLIPVELETQDCPSENNGLRHTWHRLQKDGRWHETRTELIPDSQGKCSPD